MERMHGRESDMGRRAEVLESYDATHLIGLRVMVLQSAVRTGDEDGEECVEIPRIDNLAKSATVARCLMPLRLKSAELKAIRRILNLSGRELAQKLETQPETLSRWENGVQPMGGYVEKVFRLLACELLKDEVPGIAYAARAIAEMKVIDPLRSGETEWEVPPIGFQLVKMRVGEPCGAPEIRDEWNKMQMAA